MKYFKLRVDDQYIYYDWLNGFVLQDDCITASIFYRKDICDRDLRQFLSGKPHQFEEVFENDPSLQLYRFHKEPINLTGEVLSSYRNNNLQTEIAFFRIKVSDNQYVAYDGVIDYYLCIRERASIFKCTDIETPSLLNYLKNKDYELEAVDNMDPLLDLLVFRGEKNIAYRIIFPPFDDILGKHYLGYQKSKGFYDATMHSSSIVTTQYLNDEGLLKYLKDKDFRLLQIDTNPEFCIGKFRGTR